MPYLIQKNKDGAFVQQWVLQGKPLTVGRGDKATAQIDDPEMSRQHFTITPADLDYILTDNDSRNGTFVNGKRVKGAIPLKPNDIIKAGESRFLFVEGMATVIGKLAEDPKSLRSVIREVSKK
jgi:pSer/pThr/pTyr-binding forkhead associated (FHA) protein